MTKVTPQLKRIHSPDLRDLANALFDPNEPFCVLIQAMFGPDDSDGEESFDFIICNQLWLSQHSLGGIPIDEHVHLVDSFDYDELKAYLISAAEDSAAETWKEVAAKLGKIGKWEFADYVGFNPKK